MRGSAEAGVGMRLHGAQLRAFTPLRQARRRSARFFLAASRPNTRAAMKIEKDRVVRFHYAVSEQGQDALENSRGGEPLAILQGHGNIIPGLEKAMEGHEAGDTFGVDVAAADAYGDRRDNLTQRVPKKHFNGQRLEPGMQVVLNTNFGPRAVTIEKVGMSVVDVDLNHPMAGKDLHFDVEIVDVREASEEELQHGHVHGEGGHAH